MVIHKNHTLVNYTKYKGLKPEWLVIHYTGNMTDTAKANTDYFKSVARLNTLAEYCMPFVKTGGRFIAYKGDCDGEIEEAAKAIKVLGGELEAVEKYTLTNGENRSIVVIKKVAHTPEKYPRGQGKERKCPIV